jgi:outer membrane protein TolC
MNVQRQYQETQIGLIRARASRFTDTAALFQALGGGWWNRPAEDETAAPPNRKEKTDKE